MFFIHLQSAILKITECMRSKVPDPFSNKYKDSAYQVLSPAFEKGVMQLNSEVRVEFSGLNLDKMIRNISKFSKKNNKKKQYQ